MKKSFKFLFAFAASLMSMSVLVPAVGQRKEAIEPDNIVYSDPQVAQLDRPHFASDDDEGDEEDVGPVSTVYIHYVNEDGACKNRAFYIWVNGVDGVEYSDVENGSDIVSYSDDGTSMTIKIDMNDPRFAAFKGRTTLMYIIKFKMISPSNLNWGGQSDDVELHYSEFPPVNEVVNVWCTPAAGGGMAQFATEAETKVDGIKMGKFVDWKTIRCTATTEAKKVEWSLYAFDENYYKVKAKKREPIKKNFLVRTGTTDVSTSKEFDIDFKYTAHINCVYMIVSKDISDPSKASDLTKTCFVSFEKLYENPRFLQYYTYNKAENNDLGMTYTPSQTTFKVWAPTAANMSVLLYDSDTSAAYGGDDKYKGFHMDYLQGGVWSITIQGDLKGKYYALQVDNTLGTSITMDPYATGTGRCGVRGMVYDKAETNPEGWDQLPLVWNGDTTFKWNTGSENEVTGLDITTPQELTIYEVHVADFTGDESWHSNNNIPNGTYPAFTERGTTFTEDNKTVTTGYDHLNELGVRAVQLLPVFDSDNDESAEVKKYNWGYNPLNYNCVDGMYSTDPSNGTVRIKEFKDLVLQMSKTDAHTRVIMDVVYNHVSSPSASCFNKLMPRYYFRYDENGELYDGSGCHNEVKSEAPMMRKFIVDSVTMWAREYKIKGFRFDLMGLLDYATMNEVKKACSAIDPDIYLYGEGWTAAGYHGSNDGTGSCETVDAGNVFTKCNNFDLPDGSDNTNECYLGAFNDVGRNALKGNTTWGSNMPSKGLMQMTDGIWEEPNAVADMVWGFHRGKSNYSKQSIAYVSCHDNWTLRDQLYNTIDDGKPANTYDIVHAVLATEAVVFASNAAAFMLGGEELFRTKEVTPDVVDDCLPNTYEELHGHKISHNSYNSPLSVNSFKWGNKIKVTIDGITTTDVESHYIKAFQDMIKLHHEMPKYSLSNKNGTFPSGVTTAGNEYVNLFWTGSYAGALGIQFDEYFIYLACRNQCTVPGDSAIFANTLFQCGTQSIIDNTIGLGDNGYGYAIRVCKR